MRKILWLILLFCGYIWLSTSGNDAFFLEKGKALYKALITWLDDAELDFHLTKEKSKKRSRRWD